MVGFHFVDFPVGFLAVLLDAVGADAALGFVDLAFDGIVKSSQVEVFEVAGKDVLVDAGFLLYFVVQHEGGHALLQAGGVQGLGVKFVEQVAHGRPFISLR